MNPFVAAQIRSIVESLRLLEAFVTPPLSLYSDIRMLRQAMPSLEAADLSHVGPRERRIGYDGLVDDPAQVALQSVEQVFTSLSILERVNDDPVGAEWIARARSVLARTEQKVAGDMRTRIAEGIKGLYIIVDPEATRGRSVTEVARAALRGGASVVQLRDKSRDKGVTLSDAREIKALCDEHDALFIMNDDPTLALASDAHGLHLGQADVPLSEARRVLNHHQILGLSNNSVNEVERSIALGADYLAVGAIFPTNSMGKGNRPVVGPEMITRVKQIAVQPVVAIGGIGLDNVGEVVQVGADCVCVVSAVTLTDDPEAASRALVEAIQNAKT